MTNSSDLLVDSRALRERYGMVAAINEVAKFFCFCVGPVLYGMVIET